MRRLYYLADDLRLCELIERTLAETGIRNWNFHVVSRDEIGLYQHRLHAATVYQRLDLVHTGERWGLAGAAGGLVVGLLLWLAQPLPGIVDGAVVLLATLAGGLLGAWRGALLGLSRDSYKLARFRGELDAGRHLIMVDVSDGNRARVRELMSVRFPSVEFRGRDTTLISPFAADPAT